MGLNRGKKKRIQKAPPKTRKMLRKEKRSEKKTHRADFHSKKRAATGDLSTNKKAASNGSVHNKKGPQKPSADDDEIESDFELSDVEMELKTNKGKSKNEAANQKPANKKKGAAPKPVAEDLLMVERRKEEKAQKKLDAEMRRQRITQLKDANDEEDKLIRKLEKKLGIDKAKKKNNKVPKMFDDGLDYALELCTEENIHKMYKAAKEAQTIESDDEDGGYQEDLALALGKKLPSSVRKLKKAESKYFEETDMEFGFNENDIELNDPGSDDESGEDAMDFDQDDEMSDSDVEEQPIKMHKSKKSAKNVVDKKKSFKEEDSSDDDMKLGDSSEDNESESDSNDESDSDQNRLSNFPNDSDIGSDNDNKDENPEETKKLWEDIYGRKRDQHGNVIQEQSVKYVPPHLRAVQNKEDAAQKEKLDQLRRQLKGIVNKLAEANVHKICTDVEALYMRNARHNINLTLTDLYEAVLIQRPLTNERMVLEHSLLIASLHANVGNEIGAHFLQHFVQQFNRMMANVDSYDVEDKRLDNCIFFICHLYTFKLFQHNLVYDLIQRLVNPQLSEKRVECVLLVLRAVGFSLRKDDPIRLKELIVELQKKSNEVEELRDNVRLKFMLDILLAIKNNNVNKLPQYDPSVAEHLKKILKSVIANGKYVTTLNITMEDLLKADERGKWWVVGSAWSGKDDTTTEKDGRKSSKQKNTFSDQLLQLAKAQRMNTDDRRNVFCILMSAEDYLDAFERILHLGIKDHRTIVAVLLHCCLSEATFNPYYAVLTQKFCDFDRKYQLAVQFALWDRIKDLKGLQSAGQMLNLSRFIIRMIEGGTLPISVLKVVEFGQLDKETLRLMRQIMLGILMTEDEDVCKQIFVRIAPSAKLKGFKDGIRLFMHHFLVRGASKGKGALPKDEIELLKARVLIADQVLDAYDHKVRF